MNSHTPRLLIIEDEPDSMILLLASIKELNIEVITAINGEEGLRKAISDKPDLIFLDVVLPDIDGYKLCKQLKLNSQTSHIPVIFLSGRVDLNDKLRGFNAGCIDYITKPYSAAELLARLTAQLKNLTTPPNENPVNLAALNIKNSNADSNNSKRIIEQALEFLNNNISILPNTIELAHKIGTNERKLTEVFREYLGMTVAEYHYNLRMELACRLLKETELVIEIISQNCGYKNAGDFTRAFKRTFGINPKDYRNSQR